MHSIYSHIARRDELTEGLLISNPFFGVWMLRALSQFEDTVQKVDFPCLFGQKAIKLKQYFIFFSACGRPIDDLVNGLKEYTEFVKKVPARERIYSPLAIFFERNAFATLAEEQSFAWSILQDLHNHDDMPWPQNIPTNTNSPEWSFCFNDVPLFINISCPKHKLMKSRNVGDHIAIVINPRENFDVVASAHSKGGKSIREKIRARIDVFNEGYVPTTLGFFGEEDNFEWKQYQLYEEGGLELRECPLHIVRQ